MKFGRLLKGLGKGIINVVTGGLLDTIKENKMVNKVIEETKSAGSSITSNSQFYQILDLIDDGDLNDSVSAKKAEMVGKAIGGILTAVILIWQYIANMGV